MKQLAITIIIIGVPIISACTAITGTIVGASLVGIFAYLTQKRALDFGVMVRSQYQPDTSVTSKRHV
ncbi:MAG: hypothetical protein ACPL68_06980 [Candidatus Hydrothermia bacterium]